MILGFRFSFRFCKHPFCARIQLPRLWQTSQLGPLWKKICRYPWPFLMLEKMRPYWTPFAVSGVKFFGMEFTRCWIRLTVPTAGCDTCVELSLTFSGRTSACWYVITITRFLAPKVTKVHVWHIPTETPFFFSDFSHVSPGESAGMGFPQSLRWTTGASLT